MAKRWTTEEIALLHKYYPTSGTTLVREFIFRSPDTIQSKAASLGLKTISRTYIEHPELWVEEIAHKNITPIDLYIDARTPILHRCDVCTCEWKATPSNIRRGTGCPKCASISGGLLRRNSIEYVDSVCTKHNLVRVSEYTLSQDTLVVESNICGHTWNTTLNNVQHGKGCSICNKGFGYISNKECYPEYAFLYVIHVILDTSDEFIKIGVTTNNTYERVNAIKYAFKDLHSIEVLVYLKLGALEVLELEDFILNDSNLEKYTYHCKFPGHTELLQAKEAGNILDAINMYLYEQPRIIEETKVHKMIKSFKEITARGDNLVIIDALNLCFSFRGKVDFAEAYVNMVQSLCRSYKAKYVVIACDKGSSSYRKSIYPEYKQNRKDKFELQTEEERLQFEVFFQEFEKALALLKEITAYPLLRFQGVEADDIVAYICGEVKKFPKIEHTWLISSDGDYDLLVQETISRFSYVTRKEVTLENWNERYDFSPEDYISIKCLTGDISDNVKGVAGIGPKRAASLVQEYGTALDIVSSLPIDSKYKYVQELNKSKDLIMLNYNLMDLVTFCAEAIGEPNCEIIDNTLTEYLV